jgi:hypothetical protein
LLSIRRRFADTLPDEDTYQWEFPFIKRFCVFLWGEKCRWNLGRLGVSSHQFDVPKESFLPLMRSWIWIWVRKMIWMPISSQWIWWCEFKKSVLDYGELKNAPALAEQL